jgi:hypothetical protein
MHGVPFPEQIREFVDTAPWRFAKTYAATWPHEYVVGTGQNAALILALARHIFEHGVEGRFYSHVRRYHHEGGTVCWSMAAAPEGATLINRCDERQTYEARLAAGTLPGQTSLERGLTRVLTPSGHCLTSNFFFSTDRPSTKTSSW